MPESSVNEITNEALLDYIKNGNLQVIKEIYNNEETRDKLKGAVPNLWEGAPPYIRLHEAAIHYKQKEIFQFLKENVVPTAKTILDPWANYLQWPFDAQDSACNYARLAARFGDGELLAITCTQNKTNTFYNEAGSKDKATVFHVAAYYFNTKVIQHLLSQSEYVRCLVHSQMQYGYTPLHLVALGQGKKAEQADKVGIITTVEVLACLADVSNKDDKGYTPYALAAKNGFKKEFQQAYLNTLIKFLAEPIGEESLLKQNIVGELVDNGLNIDDLPALFEKFKKKYPNIGFQYQRQAQGLIYYALWAKQQTQQAALLKYALWTLPTLIVPIVLLLVWGWKKVTAPIKASEIEPAMYKSYKEEKAKSDAKINEKTKTVQRKPFPDNADALSIFKQKKNPDEPSVLAKALIFEAGSTTNAPVKPEHFHGVVLGIKEALTQPGNVLILGSQNQVKKFENKFDSYQAEQKKAGKK